MKYCGFRIKPRARGYEAYRPARGQQGAIMLTAETQEAAKRAIDRVLAAQAQT